jgi:hypothetical protein
MVALGAGLAVVIVGSGVASAKQVSATTWAAAACAAQNKFIAVINSAAPGGFSAVQSELSGGNGDLPTAKSQLVAFFDAATTAAKPLRSEVKKAGIPKITNGDKIEANVLATAQTIQKVLAGAKKKVGTLSTTDAAAFKATGSKVLADFSSLQKLNQKSSKTIKKLDKDHKVASTLNSCSGGGSSSSGSGGGGNSGAGTSGGATPAPTAAPAGGTSGGGGRPGY